jgi:hypothetical protein
MNAQEPTTDNAKQTFESRARAIADKIEQITKEEKEALRSEVALVNERLDIGEITVEEADEQKLALAEKRARNIETRTAGAQEQLRLLVQEKVDGNVKSQDTSGRYTFAISFPIEFRDKERERRRLDTLRGDSRTTSQFVYSIMLNSLVTDGAFANSSYSEYMGNAYEWGISYTTRILKNSNLLQAKYGLSLMYNNLEQTKDRYFVRDGDVTNLVETDLDLDHSRLRNVYLSVPLHLEFDFGKQKSAGVFRKQRGWRLGIGGFGGFRVKSKQVLRYEVDGDKVETRTKGDFNVNDFNYGLSSYIGYKALSLYVKYDVQPIFENNPVEQNNISAGIRWDFD